MTLFGPPAWAAKLCRLGTKLLFTFFSQETQENSFEDFGENRYFLLDLAMIFGSSASSGRLLPVKYDTGAHDFSRLLHTLLGTRSGMPSLCQRAWARIVQGILYGHSSDLNGGYKLLSVILKNALLFKFELFSKWCSLNYDVNPDICLRSEAIGVPTSHLSSTISPHGANRWIKIDASQCYSIRSSWIWILKNFGGRQVDHKATRCGMTLCLFAITLESRARDHSLNIQLSHACSVGLKEWQRNGYFCSQLHDKNNSADSKALLHYTKCFWSYCTDFWSSRWSSRLHVEKFSHVEILMTWTSNTS